MKLSEVLNDYAKDLDVSGPQYATMARYIREGAKCAEACEWIAAQPIIGEAASMEEMRERARRVSWWDIRGVASQAVAEVQK